MKGLSYTFKDEIKKREHRRLRERVAEGTQYILSRLEEAEEPVTCSELIGNLPEEVNEKR